MRTFQDWINFIDNDVKLPENYKKEFIKVKSEKIYNTYNLNFKANDKYYQFLENSFYDNTIFINKVAEIQAELSTYENELSNTIWNTISFYTDYINEDIDEEAFYIQMAFTRKLTVSAQKMLNNEVSGYYFNDYEKRYVENNQELQVSISILYFKHFVNDLCNTKTVKEVMKMALNYISIYTSRIIRHKHSKKKDSYSDIFVIQCTVDLMKGLIKYFESLIIIIGNSTLETMFKEYDYGNTKGKKMHLLNKFSLENKTIRGIWDAKKGEFEKIINALISMQTIQEFNNSIKKKSDNNIIILENRNYMWVGKKGLISEGAGTQFAAFLKALNETMEIKLENIKSDEYYNFFQKMLNFKFKKASILISEVNNSSEELTNYYKKLFKKTLE